jgi:aryl-alcohol dehydrogenase-like predicted oxidoreductase
LRRKVEAGSPEAKVAYQFALAQQAVQAAGTSAEKARRNRELLELEKAAVAATTTQKLAAAYKQLRRRGGGKAKADEDRNTNH